MSDNDIGAFLNRDREHPDARFDAPSSRSTNRKGAHIGVRGKCWVTEFCWGRVPPDDRPTVRPLGKPALNLSLVSLGSWILVVLLSLWLWATICEVIVLSTSVVLR